MMIDRFDHIVLTVRSLEATLSFSSTRSVSSANSGGARRLR